MVRRLIKLLLVLTVLGGPWPRAFAQQLNPGSGVVGTFSPSSPLLFYTFEGEAGSQIDLALMGLTPGLEPVVSLNSPTQQQLANSAAGNPTLRRLALTLPQTGIYTVLVSSLFGTAGDIALALTALPDNGAICGDGSITPSEACDDGNALAGDGCNAGCDVEPGFSCAGEPSVCRSLGDLSITGITAEIATFSASAPLAFYTFSGAAGEQVDLVAVGLTAGVTPGVVLLSPTQQSLSPSTPDPGNPGLQRTAVTLPQSGIYTVMVSSMHGTQGDAALLVTTFQRDADQDGVVDLQDDCPRWPDPDQLDRDQNGRGDLCECGDQSGDGTLDVRDLVEINLAIFDPARASPLCDANADRLCNVSDIISANRGIFGAETYCGRHPLPGDERCGNGILEELEICDDGNLAHGDGCHADCLPGVCGDGVLDPSEECDDGNFETLDGCSASCEQELIAPPDGQFNSPLDVPLGSSAGVSDFVSSPLGDGVDRVRYQVLGMNPNPVLPGGRAQLVVIASCLGQNPTAIEFSTGGGTAACGDKVVDREVTADTDTGTITITATGGDKTHVQWTLSGAATPLN